MENYTNACRQRLSLWISPEIEVEGDGPLSIGVRSKDRRLLLAFDPRHCVWSMTGDHTCGGYNFDRLLKKARQALTLNAAP
jgi:hypothetical protein